MSSKDELHHQLLQAQQEYIASAILTNNKIAESLGMHVVDLQALGLIFRHGKAMTPSEISEAIQLPLSSTTRVLDRLEKRKLIKRQNDKVDRRRVFVELNPKALQELGDPWRPLTDLVADIHGQFSEDELKSVLKYFSATLDAKSDLNGK